MRLYYPLEFIGQNTKDLDDLKAALGDRVAGVRIGMTPQTLWSEVLEITKDSRAANADLLITLGGGSLTDAAKLVSFVCNPGRSLG
jgi:alcohol dehydrogenase class IV